MYKMQIYVYDQILDKLLARKREMKLNIYGADMGPLTDTAGSYPLEMGQLETLLSICNDMSFMYSFDIIE